MITPEVLIKINEVLFECNNVPRWSSVISSPRYTESAKQCLNCMIAVFLAEEARHVGEKVDNNQFPKIAIHRLLEKSIMVDLRSEITEELCEMCGVKSEDFNAMLNEQMAEKSSKEFVEFTTVPMDCIELKIYNAARRLATFIELQEIRRIISTFIYEQKKAEILESMKPYMDLPGMRRISTDGSPEMEIFQDFSSLRNRMRWVRQPVLIPCSVLAHQMDTAAFSYLDVLGKNETDEDGATKLFFVGLFHDVAEAWTGDMPSPVKDALPGLREATEKLEEAMLQKHIISKLPDYTAKAYKSWQVEEGKEKKEMKKADYMSANAECWRQLVAGTRSNYFKNVLVEAEAKAEASGLSPNMTQLLDHMCDILKE